MYCMGQVALLIEIESIKMMEIDSRQKSVMKI